MAILQFEALSDHDPEPGDIGTYTYSADTDTYTTFLPTGSLTVPGAKHRAMLADYTGTKALSIDQMSLKYDMPRSWFEQYKRIHDWRHSSVPLTDEQILAAPDLDTLATETVLNARRHNITQSIADAEYKALRADAEKYRTFETTILEHFRELPAAPTEVPALKIGESSNPYALVVCPTDFHWGKHGWEDEVGETYNLKEARTRLFDRTQALIDRLSSNPEKIYVSVGSDWFHVDNDAGTTTRGTPQDMCASPAEILISGCQLAREHIDLLRQVAPVELISMPGNHDRMSTYALMMYLSAAYENCEDVSVTITSASRRYVTYGDNLLGFTHGDGLKRGNSLALLMANESKSDWGATSHHMWFHGHLHHQRMTEKDGVLIFQMPSLAGHDRYHYRSGYTMSAAGLAAYIIDYYDGYIGSFFAPVSHSEE